MWGGIDCLASTLNTPLFTMASHPFSVVDVICLKVLFNSWASLSGVLL